jgi:hypothetical protein
MVVFISWRRSWALDFCWYCCEQGQWLFTLVGLMMYCGCLTYAIIASLRPLLCDCRSVAMSLCCDCYFDTLLALGGGTAWAVGFRKGWPLRLTRTTLALLFWCLVLVRSDVSLLSSPLLMTAWRATCGNAHPTRGLAIRPACPMMVRYIGYIMGYWYRTGDVDVDFMDMYWRRWGEGSQWIWLGNGLDCCEGLFMGMASVGALGEGFPWIWLCWSWYMLMEEVLALSGYRSFRMFMVVDVPLESLLWLL